MRAQLPCLALLLLAAPAARAEEAAPAPPDARPAEAPVPGATWKACRVEVTTLYNSAAGSRVAGRDTALLFQGSDFEITREIPVDDGQRQALIRLRARIRASVARQAGVVYRVTTQATLASAVGFSSADVGQDQARDEDVAFDEDRSPRLFDAFASPDLASRVLLAITARPVQPDEKVPGDDLGGPGDVRDFRVEALLKEKDGQRVIEQAVLSAMPGTPASLSFGSLGAASLLPADPAHRLGAGVRVVDLGGLPDSGFGGERTQRPERRPAETGYADANRVKWDDDFLRDHVVVVDDKDDPHHVTVERKSPKISATQARKLRALQEAEGRRRIEEQRDRTLPAGPDVPAGFEKEELVVSVRPLHATRDQVQAEIGVHGHIKLPKEDQATELSASFVEQLPVGEPYVLGLAALARGGDPDYDYLLRITPLP